MPAKAKQRLFRFLNGYKKPVLQRYMIDNFIDMLIEGIVNHAPGGYTWWYKIDVKDQKEFKRRLREHIRQTLFIDSFYESFTEVYLEENGGVKVDVLSSWVLDNLFGGDLRDMLWYLQKVRREHAR